MAAAGRRALLLWLLAALIVPASGPAQSPRDFPLPDSQPPPFLILDQDRLFNESRLGRSIIEKNEAETEALRREGRQLDRQFEAEERALADRRDDFSPERFRELADAFDAKVVRTRREQEEKATDLAARIESRRRDFFRRAAPVLLRILEETGAAAIVDQRDVLIAKQDLNITEEAITRLDAEFRAQQRQETEDPDTPADPAREAPGEQE